MKNNVHLTWDKQTCNRYCKDSEKILKNDYVPWANRIFSRNTTLNSPVIADIGCGPGFLSLELSKYWNGCNLFLVDSSTEMLDFAAGKAKNTGVPVNPIQAIANNTSIASSSIDITVCKHILLSLSDYQSFIEEMHRIMKKGSKLYIIDANPQSSVLLAIISCLYCRLFVSSDRAIKAWNAYKNGISSQTIVDAMKKTGFNSIVVSTYFPMAYMIEAIK